MKSDVPPFWGIMPVYRRKDSTEWCVIGDSHVVTIIRPTKQQAFDIAAEHNKLLNIHAVYVYGADLKGGEWEYLGASAPRGMIELDIDPAALAVSPLTGTSKDASSWRIMPFWRPQGDEWWVIEPDKLPNVTKILPTKEEAFNIALAHNKESGVNAVWVYGGCMKGGGWVQK